MTTKVPVKTIIEPELPDLLGYHKDEIMEATNVAKVGEIRSFDGTKRTAQVQILFKRVLSDGSFKSYPLLVDVPVVTIQGGGGYIQMPIAAGDQCLVIFADARLDEWFENGSEAPPAEGRMHDLSDGIAIVGLNALPSDLPAYPTNKVSIGYGSSKIDLLDSEIDIVPTGGKVKVGNGTVTLETLVESLITAIEGITVTGGLAVEASSIAVLEAVKVQFQALLI